MGRKYCIGIITPFYFPNTIGGSEVSTQLLAEMLAEKGYRVVVFSFDGEYKSEEIVNKVKVYREPKRKGVFKKLMVFAIFLQVLKVLRIHEKEVDIYHVYNCYPLAPAGLYKYLGGRTPVIATLNNYTGFCPKLNGICNNNYRRCLLLSKYKCLNNVKMSMIKKIMSYIYFFVYSVVAFLAKNIDKYIALSSDVKDAYTENGFKETKIEVIPNIIDKIKYENKIINEESKGNILLYVGRLDEAKGVDLLINAIERLMHTIDNLQLNIIGNGPMMEDLKNKVKKLRLENIVKFYGHIPYENLGKYYKGADLFVHPALWPEPFGRTICEAMSYNLPCLVSSIGAPPSIVGDAGLVFRVGDLDDLVNKISMYLSNVEMRKELRSRCQTQIEFFMAGNPLQKIIDIYEQVVP